MRPGLFSASAPDVLSTLYRKKAILRWADMNRIKTSGQSIEPIGMYVHIYKNLKKACQMQQKTPEMVKKFIFFNNWGIETDTNSINSAVPGKSDFGFRELHPQNSIWYGWNINQIKPKWHSYRQKHVIKREWKMTKQLHYSNSPKSGSNTQKHPESLEK